jgi:hypothetical protein
MNIPKEVQDAKPGELASVDAVWLRQILTEYGQYGTINTMLREEATKLQAAHTLALKWVESRDELIGTMNANITTLSRMLDASQQLIDGLAKERSYLQGVVDSVKEINKAINVKLATLRKQRERALVGKSKAEKDFILRGVFDPGMMDDDTPETPQERMLRTAMDTVRMPDEMRPLHIQQFGRGARRRLVSDDERTAMNALHASVPLDGRGAQNWQEPATSADGSEEVHYSTEAPELPALSVGFTAQVDSAGVVREIAPMDPPAVVIRAPGVIHPDAKITVSVVKDGTERTIPAGTIIAKDTDGAFTPLKRERVPVAPCEKHEWIADECIQCGAARKSTNKK